MSEGQTTTTAPPTFGPITTTDRPIPQAVRDVVAAHWRALIGTKAGRP
jgi:hypothetical protein